MNKQDIKYVFLCILMMIFIIFLIYASFKLVFSVFSSRYVISVTNKNKQEISTMLEEVRIQEDKITRLELEIMLGDAELRVYDNFKLCKKRLISDGADIVTYMCEEGSSIRIKYMFFILIAIILIAIDKELIDSTN